MHSLRSKVLLIASALILVTELASVSLILYLARQDVAARAVRSLAAAGEVYRQHARQRAGQLSAAAGTVAADYGLKQAVASGDAPTIRSALANHAHRAGASLALLHRLDGSPVAATGDPALAGHFRPAADADPAVPQHGLLLSGGQGFETYTVALRAPLPVAWVTLGYPLDDRYARDLAALTGQDVSLVARLAGGSRWLASSRPPADRRRWSAAALERALAGPGEIAVDGDRILVAASPLLPADPRLQLLFSRSLAAAMEPYELLRSAALLLAAIPLLIGIVGAWWLAGTVAGPVELLTRAARRMQSGDYGRPVDLSSDDEFGQLASAFNAMQAGIAERERRILHQARHDGLTGLPTRDRLLERLGDLLAGPEPPDSVAVVKILLNAFVDISESLGHDIADAYVRQAGAQLNTLLMQRGWLARSESDVFIAVLPGIDATSAEGFAAELSRSLAAGVALRELTVPVRPALGIAVAPENGSRPEQLLLRASIAASRAAETGLACQRYRRGDEEQRVRRTRIVAELRKALQDGQLSLRFQPKLRMRDGKLIGAEALLRWEHPDLGPVSPAEFIPIAERSGSIGALTRWVLETAITECRLWEEAGLVLAVSVNLSPADLLDRELPWLVADCLRGRDLGASRLIVEVTEEAIVRNFKQAVAVLEQMRQAGVRVSMDDFGTGYSSLAQLKRLPIDELKIDRSFVTGLPAAETDCAIVKAVISLADSLGLSLVAEGVETAEAWAWLRRQGAGIAQGYAISRPLVGEEFLRWASSGPAVPGGGAPASAGPGAA